MLSVWYRRFWEYSSISVELDGDHHPHTLIGEEIYAAEAYLTPTATPQARLLTHDALRTVVVWLMLIAFGYGFIRIAFGWPVLAGW